jgi:hypothetical protein
VLGGGNFTDESRDRGCNGRTLASRAAPAMFGTVWLLTKGLGFEQLIVELAHHTARGVAELAAERELAWVNERDHLQPTCTRVVRSSSTVAQSGLVVSTSLRFTSSLWPRLGGVDLALTPSDGPPVVLELKCGAGNDALAASQSLTFSIPTPVLRVLRLHPPALARAIAVGVLLGYDAFEVMCADRVEQGVAVVERMGRRPPTRCSRGSRAGRDAPHTSGR